MRKRIVAILLTIALLMGILPVGVAAADEVASGTCGENLTWVLDSDGVLTISGSGAMDNWSTGSSWSSRSAPWYSKKQAIKEIVISDGVTSIGDEAFEGCNSLVSITIPDSVTSIGDDAFVYCSSLASITIPDSVTSIGDDAFYGCSSLTSITIPDSVTSIGIAAFWGCSSLTDVYYGGSQKEWNNIDIYSGNKCLTDATIHYNSISAGAQIGALTEQIPNDKYGIFVVDSSGKPVPGAMIKWSYNSVFNGTVEAMEQTDANGMALFDKFTEGEPLIEISCDNYQSYTNKNSNYSKSSDGFEIIVLYKNSESKYKLSHAYYNQNIDLLSGTKKLNLKNTGNFVGDLTSGNFTLSCQAINSSDVKEYQLWQGKNTIASSTDGNFNLNVEDGFVSGGNCFVRVVPNNGTAVDTPINLTFTSNAVNKATGIKLGDSAKITVKDNVPFLGGSTFTIGDLPPLPVEVELTEDKVYIGFNTDIWSSGSSSTDSQKKGAFADFKESLAKVKKANAGMGRRNSQLMNSLMKQESDFKLPGGKVKVNLIGYAEADWGSTTATGEIYLQCSASTPTFGFTTWVVVVPVTVQIGGKFEAQVGAIISYDWEAATLVGEFPFDASIALEAFGGVGVGKVVGAGAYGSAKLAASMNLLCDPFLNAIDLTGKLGVKAYIGPFEYERPFAYNTWHLYSANTVSAASIDSLENEEGDTLFSQDAYQMSDLSYLEEESEWMGYGISLFSAEPSVNNLTPLQTGTYRNMQPVIGTANDIPVMVWLRGNLERGTGNAAQLVYSIYQDGVWCEPQPVDANNETADGAHAIYTGKDGTLYLIYQSASDRMTDQVSQAEYAANQTIVVTVFDVDTMAFTDITTIAGEAEYYYNPAITVIDGVPTAAWIANPHASDFFGQNATNELHCAQLTDHGWLELPVLAEEMNAVAELCIGKIGEETMVSIISDGDNDLSTTDDRTLTCYELNGSSAEVKTGNLSAVRIEKLPGSSASKLLWLSDGAFQAWDGTDTETVFEETSITDSYQVLSDRILFLSATEESSNIFAVTYDNGWQETVQITDQDYYLQSFAASEIGGVTYLSAVQVDVTIDEGSVIDECTLSWGTMTPFVDLAITSTSIDYVQASAGDDYSLYVDVLNQGDAIVSGYTVTVSSGDTEIVSRYVDEVLLSGAQDTLEITIPALDSNAYEQTYTVTLSMDNDMDIEDNTALFQTGYTDLMVDANQYQVGNDPFVIVTVKNNAIVPSEGALHVYCGETEVSQIDFDVLAQNQKTLLQVNLNTDILNGNDAGNLRFVVESNKNDWNDINNHTEISVNIASEVHSHQYESNSLTEPTCTEEGKRIFTCSCGDSYTEVTPPLGHNFTTYVSDGNATCTEDGTKTAKCDRCDETDTITDTGSKLGHSFTTYVYNNDAKVGVDGTETATCDRDGCDATDTRTAVGTALPAPPVTFTDVPSSAYYAPAVNWAVANNITAGTTPSTFSPDDTCTRAQVVAFLWRAAGRPEPETANNPFTDVKTSDYFYKAVLWASENGIVYGTSSTTFSPNQGCTRGQVAAFLWRAAGRPEPTTGNNPFTDVKASAYYGKAVIWAAENKIVYGTSATQFSPDTSCTRAQIVTFLYRTYGK